MTRPRRLRKQRVEVAAWVKELRQGWKPLYRTPQHDLGYVGWLYFGDSVEGLPDADSDAGRAINERARYRLGDMRGQGIERDRSGLG